MQSIHHYTKAYLTSYSSAHITELMLTTFELHELTVYSMCSFVLDFILDANKPPRILSPNKDFLLEVPFVMVFYYVNRK